MTLQQQTWVDRAKGVLPAGGLGHFDPGIIIREGKGARVWDENGKEYIDYLIGSGPMFIGHSHPEVNDAVQSQLGKGSTFFATNAAAIELAEVICEAMPCAERLRYVSTGSEADMYGIRLARAFTGRDKIIKFEGGYHGMSAEAQMSLAPKTLVNYPQCVPDSAGIPASVRDDVLVAPYNDLAVVQSLVDEFQGEIAGIIVEPLQRIIPPEPGFLQGLRDICDKNGMVLVFDEVVTGFRFSYGGAQQYYGVTPDICTLGKIIGGGFPLGAIAGRADIMDHFDMAAVGAEGFLMQYGTLSGNPIASVAGLKTLEILRRGDEYSEIRSKGKRLMNCFSDSLTKAGYDVQIVGDPVLFDPVFTDKPVRNYRDTFGADQKTNTRFNQLLRENGIFKSPGKVYPCMALTDEDMEFSIDAIEKAAREL